MSAAEVATIGAVVTVLTQLIKRATPSDGYGLYIAGVVSAVVVFVWVVSGAEFPPSRTDIWALFAGWVSVFATAAGIYGITTTPTSAEALREERIARVRAARE